MLNYFGTVDFHARVVVTRLRCSRATLAASILFVEVSNQILLSITKF